MSMPVDLIKYTAIYGYKRMKNSYFSLKYFAMVPETLVKGQWKPMQPLLKAVHS